MSLSKRIVIIDNYDSFTYNLFQIFDQYPNCSVKVIPFDKVVVEDLKEFDQIVFSPGPDVPSSYPILGEILQTYKGEKPILGVCLGHQAIGEFFGATLYNLPQVYHGQKQALILNEKQEGLYQGLVEPIYVGLYHSWALSKENFPKELEITAWSEQGIIMSISHINYNIKGIQFHPESYMCEQGAKLINNWIEQN